MANKRRPATPPIIANASYLDYLGSGGFADVYLYQQQIPHREVAIKVLRRGVSERQRESFRAEINLMARMSSHPAVVPVHGAGETDDGRMYIIMEYCPPPHMGKRLRERTIAVHQVLEIGVLLAGAVESLHRQGIVHRDIKPSNILMTQYQSPVLTDFGIATRIGDERPAEGFSVPWSPPEQATGEGIALPSMDVYSLAATIYTLLAGRAPFEIEGGDNSEIAMINRVLRAPLPPTGRPDVPAELEHTLRVAMSKNPEERYSSVKEFATALQYIQVIQLGQRATEMSVLDEESYPSGSYDDDEVTRAAIRSINPQGEDDEETRIAPRRVNPHSSVASKQVNYGGVGRGIPAVPSPPYTGGQLGAQENLGQGNADLKDGYGSWPSSDIAQGVKETEGNLEGVPLHSSVVGIPYSYADSGENKDTEAFSAQENLAEGGNSRTVGEKQKGSIGAVKYLLSLVVVLVITVVTIYFFSSDTEKIIKPDPSPTTSIHNVEEADPVVGLSGRVEGDSVVFTWSQPADKRKGDTFLYYVDQVGNSEVINETKETKVTVPIRKPETCLVVSVKTKTKGVKDSVESIACVSTQ